jgi:phage tail sheath protein FI
MAFQISPGVNVTEIDLTTIVPAVATTTGAIAGNFNWGPVEQRFLITNENDLIAYFGRPNANNQETFYTAANFLNYGNSLYVARAASASQSKNAVANSTVTSATVSPIFVKNQDDYNSQGASTISTNSGAAYIAKYPGALGSSLKISVCDSANAYSSTIYPTVSGIQYSIAFSVGSNTATVTVANTVAGASTPPANSVLQSFVNSIITGDYLVAGNASSASIGAQFVKVSGAPASNASGWTLASNAYTATINLTSTYTLSNNFTQTGTSSSSNILRYWEYYNLVDKAPGTSPFVSTRGGTGDEIHIIVADEDGKISGTPGTVLETFPAQSRATDAYGPQGGSIFYQTVLNTQSNWVWYVSERAGAPSNTAANMTPASTTLPNTLSFAGGVDSLPEGGAGGATNMAMADIVRAYNLFVNAEDVDISLILAGKAAGVGYTQVANYLIDNLAEVRKDCVVFISPNYETVVNNFGDVASSVVSFRNNIHNSSYAVIDSGYKYTYDRYNDKYIYVPLNGDIAGTVVRTDNVRDPWFSPAGYNRGSIKNVIKLAFNPNKAQRDTLYKSDVNPVVTFPGQGTVLFGDKTALGKPSAFDRINVRRLFIVLEKSIATAAKFTLFEFNDAFTRAQFRNLVEPYLRDVQGRRGIYDFKVICDETNNTPERIDRNEFWGDIYIKPARAINFIQLNFVAVRTGVQFEEVVGQF